jgi:hypothetical protein
VRVLKKEALEAHHTSIAFLAIADAPNDSPVVPAAFHVVIHNCKNFNDVRNCS